MKTLTTILAAAVLAGCATGPQYLVQYDCTPFFSDAPRWEACMQSNQAILMHNLEIKRQYDAQRAHARAVYGQALMNAGQGWGQPVQGDSGPQSHSYDFSGMQNGQWQSQGMRCTTHLGQTSCQRTY